MKKIVSVLFLRQLKKGYINIDGRFDPTFFKLHTAASFAEAMQLYPNARPMLAFVDFRSLATEAGYLCDLLQDRYPLLPVIAVVGRKPGVGKSCSALLKPPFTPQRILLLSQRVLTTQPSHHILRAGPIEFNRSTSMVTGPRHSQRLSPKLSKLLELFMESPGKVFPRSELIRAVWQPLNCPETLSRTLEVHIYWLRQVIEREPRRPQFLRTVRSVGYQFVIPSGDQSGA